MRFPKIELHVRLEGTVRAATLLQIARRNDVALPAMTVAGLAELGAAEAASHGAVYLGGIFSPSEPAGRGADWDAVFAGYCDGAQEACELPGVDVRLTPDVTRSHPVEAAVLCAQHAVRYAGRGVVGLGLGGLEAAYRPERYARAFDIARAGGLGSVPHAGEAAGVGVNGADCSAAALCGALCDDGTRAELAQLTADHQWADLARERQ